MSQILLMLEILVTTKINILNRLKLKIVKKYIESVSPILGRGAYILLLIRICLQKLFLFVCFKKGIYCQKSLEATGLNYYIVIQNTTVNCQ